MKNIRNFCIIAHIDHGKSTLADRMMEITWSIKKSEQWQVLDKLSLEQERWITIKLTPTRMQWQDYELNLIDTPWHVDFQYEVSRSLSWVEWTILLVDATQWIQAQTLSTLYMALDYWLEIIPVLNKIDLPAANAAKAAEEIQNLVWVDKNEIIKVSAKTWKNVEKVLDQIIQKIKNPLDFLELNKEMFYHKNTPQKIKDENNITRALIFDSVYDKYKWVVAYVKVLNWYITPNTNLKLANTQIDICPSEVGYFSPEYTKCKQLSAGQIWYILTWQKSVRDAKIWDTFIWIKNDKNNSLRIKDFNIYLWKTDYPLSTLAIPGFKKMKPYVYSWVYPLSTEDFEKLRDSFEKLTLNDSAIDYEYENSIALWHWFRAGFLWTLHMDIIRQRLEREYNVQTVFTMPNVIYLVQAKDLTLEKIKAWTNVSEIVKTGYYKYIIWEFGEWDNEPSQEEIMEKYKEQLKSWLIIRAGNYMPDPWKIEKILEPMAEVEIVWPSEYSGNIMELAQTSRWKLHNMEYIDAERILRRYEIPLAEIIVDFYDFLKSNTKWFATMNYEFKSYKTNDLTRIDILINNEKIWAFSLVSHKDKAYNIWKSTVEKLKELIPKHLFPVPIQAAIGSRVIARETIPALKKDVIAKCYGWDVTRKRKLLAKQKEWKKKMKQMWSVNVPSDIFIKMVSRN